MFQVKPETVQGLFDAQQEHVQGKLRLDVSSRVVPDNAQQKLDVVRAQEAVGERFLRTVAGFVDGVTVDWPPNHAVEQVEFMRVCTDRNHRFVEYEPSRLTNDLIRVFGLQ
jgi:hypothetical protein